jgi:hypothetical protein
MRGSATLNGKRSVWDGIPQAACLVEAKLCAARPGESTHKPVVQAAIGRIPCRLFNIRTKFVRIFERRPVRFSVLGGDKWTSSQLKSFNLLRSKSEAN